MARAEGDLLLLPSSGPSPHHSPNPGQVLGEAIPGAGAVWGQKAAGFVQQRVMRVSFGTMHICKGVKTV